ncbi:insulin-like growth factor-binding protein 7 [Palaemon carinicauda]|uniref:insulin-like growth factor-binding protein 7 n=1 Tax=Palaemon carinicauda TaxID=392227 RepID=UPI0035B57656
MIRKSIPVALVCMLMLDVTFGFLPPLPPLFAISREDESREDIGSSGSTNVRPPSSGGLPVVGGSSSVGVQPSGGAQGGSSGSVIGGGGNALGPCDDVCTKILEPLCGSDGRDYNNQCILRNANCRSQLNGGPAITVVHTGFCNRRG